MENVEIFPSIAWSAGPGCHGGCGQKLHVKDGKLIRVEGDENHPWNQGRACPRVLALTQYMYHPDRIIHPLKRVGERGSGKFERISWDEAFDTIAKRIHTGLGSIQRTLNPKESATGTKYMYSTTGEPSPSKPG